MKSLIPLRIGLFLAALCSAALAQESYRLLPADLSPENHPSKQIGFQLKGTTTTEHLEGTIIYSINDEGVNHFAEGSYEAKSVGTREFEVLEDSQIRCLMNINRKSKVIIDGQETKQSEEDSISGKPLIIDMKPAVPSVNFENQREPDAAQQWHMKLLKKEHQARKNLNPWTEEQLLYGTQERQVGDRWSLDETQRKELAEWLSQVYLVDQGDYEIHSAELEFVEVIDIEGTPHAILKLESSLSNNFHYEEQDTILIEKGKISMRIERDLENFIDSSTEYTMKGTHQMLSEMEQGLETKIESPLLVSSKETRTLPSTPE